MGAFSAQESLAIGINWMLAPVVDVNNNPENPIINIRSFGETDTSSPAIPGRTGKTVHSSVTAELSTQAVSRNALRNIPKAPFQSLGIFCPQCGQLKCFELPNFW